MSDDMGKATTLLTLLASVPPEWLVEGAVLSVIRIADGTDVTVTVGKRVLGGGGTA